MGRRRFDVLLGNVLNLATGVVVVLTVYFLFTERLLPSLRSEPVRVPEGGALTDSFSFRPLAEPKGKTKAYRYIPDARPVLLLFYDSTCPACYANLSAWRSALEAADEGTMVLAVALEEDRGAAEAYARRQLPGAFPVQAIEPRELLATLGVEIVPHTVLVGIDGTLRFVRPGRLDEQALEVLIRALGRPDGDLIP